MSDDELKCNFCSKGQNEVKKLINNDDVYICSECVELCYNIIQEENVTEFDTTNIPNPEDIYNFLDQYVIGQSHAKKSLSVAVHKHYKRLKNPIIDDIEIEKSNILIVGPTGCGKTYLARTLARYLDVPFAMTDATSLTEAGYVGDDVENIIVNLYQAADGDVEKTQQGIIYIDEIDKLSKRGDSASITKDVGGEGVQQALLKILEGTTCRVPPEGGRKHPTQEVIEIDTTNILFILGGAFVGLDTIIEKDRSTNEASIGFGAKVKSKDDENPFAINSDVFQFLEPQHLYKFGIIPEFIGRIPIFSYVESLKPDQLIQVMSEPKNAILKQYQKMFQLEGVKLTFTPDALTEVVNKSVELRTGARALRRILESILLDIEFHLPSLAKDEVKEIIINGNVVLGKEEPQYIK